jgi:hypothetical protein
MKYVLPFSLLKAKDYSKLQPVKVQDKNGNMVTRWMSPEDAKQMSMFDGKTEGAGGEEGYFNEVKKNTYEYQVSPLIHHAGAIDKELSKRLDVKYKNYAFDQDTMDLDIKLDYETVKFLSELKKYPEKKEEIQADYDKATMKLSQQINNRKKAMLKLKPGMEVKVRNNGKGVLKKFTKRGFPLIDTGKEVKPLFPEELQVG